MIPNQTVHPQSGKWNVIAGLAFAILVIASLCLFFIPAVIIRPFSHQSPAALALAMVVRQQAPLCTLVAVGLAMALALRLWPRISVWKRAVLGLGLLLASASAVMSRVDYFEWMFHPVEAPGFTSAGQAKLAAEQMVMAVRLGSDARAYPIRAMAYHHVVNDVVAGVPIVVTY